MENLTPKLDQKQLQGNIDALVKQNAPREVVQSYINNYTKDPSGFYVLKPKGSGITPQTTEEKRLALESQGQSVSVNPDKVDPTFAGEVVRGVAKPFAKFATNAVNAGQFLAGKEKTNPFAGKYLGNDVDAYGFENGKALPFGEKVKESLGGGLEVASTVVGGGAEAGIVKGAIKGAIKKAVVDGLKSGAVVGGSQGLGNALEKDKGVVDTITDTVTGALTGAGFGAATAGVTSIIPGMKALSQKTQKTLSEIPNIESKFKNFLASDPEEKVVTILRETPSAKFDEYVNIAKEAVTDPRKLTPLEVVGDRLTDATKQIQKQTSSLSKQKSEIISKAKTGLVDFKKETGDAILAVTKELKDSNAGTSFIQRLKKVKTKLDADKAIDDLQDTLYKGNRDLTIPEGSKEDKILRKILSNYNNTLKDSLPPAYRKLNEQISDRIKVINSLNTALGEVVEGTSVRGAGMIKQFFSPSGRKTKELFEFIKKETGMDLAQDATLAKFTMDLFDDSRAAQLLEGVPTSVGGVINKVIDFAVDKTGVGKRAQEGIRNVNLGRARKFTK